MEGIIDIVMGEIIHTQKLLNYVLSVRMNYHCAKTVQVWHGTI